MTEHKWLTSGYPLSMLRSLEFTGSGRKNRLFCCAALRTVWPWLKDVRGRRAVEVAERFADGEASFEEMFAAAQDAVTSPLFADPSLGSSGELYVAVVASGLGNPHAYGMAVAAVRAVEQCRGATPLAEIRRGLSNLLREVHGNPFRPAVIDPEWQRWNNSIVPRLAKGIYRDRQFDGLPILADALEEAGCDKRDLLDHLRRPGGHFLGCWALDAVLGLK